MYGTDLVVNMESFISSLLKHTDLEVLYMVIAHILIPYLIKQLSNI